MLLLSRKKGEIITIGKSVQIEVIDYGRGSVTLGVVAPKNIPVHRKEVFDAIVKQNQQAAQTKVSAAKKTLSNLTIEDKNTK